jgi:diadenosine tetraphosphatase ApaH/serine/threonine PP2A family protein phosphatase
MRYLVLSDIHANLQALDAVLEDATARGFDEVLVLGDLVGYGADPAGVLDRTLALSPTGLIRGNHDKVCAGLESALFFNDVARASAEWTSATLSPGHMVRLAALPQGPQRVTEAIQICHGAPFDEDYYIFDVDDASRAIDASEARICLFGHTHVPAFFTTNADPGTAAGEGNEQIRLPATGPALINVGSVGQPRDGDPRAAYGLLDVERWTIEFCRVVYDVAGAQEAIRRAGLPPWLGARLAKGR